MVLHRAWVDTDSKKFALILQFIVNWTQMHTITSYNKHYIVPLNNKWMSSRNQVNSSTRSSSALLCTYYTSRLDRCIRHIWMSLTVSRSLGQHHRIRNSSHCWLCGRFSRHIWVHFRFDCCSKHRYEHRTCHPMLSSCMNLLVLCLQLISLPNLSNCYSS